MSNVNHELKSIFIHIPKCAGSSMEASRSALGKGSGHKTLQSYSNNIKEFSSYYKWCFVRNPWDRAVAAWDTCPELKSAGVNTFEKFIDILYNERHKIQNHPFLKWTKRGCQKINAFPVQRIHWFPMLPMIKVNNVVEIDYVGRFENLEKDWSFLTWRIFRLDKAKLPKHNIRENKKPYQEFYNDKLIDQVAEIYKEDIKAFGYSYDRL